MVLSWSLLRLFHFDCIEEKKVLGGGRQYAYFVLPLESTKTIRMYAYA